MHQFFVEKGGVSRCIASGIIVLLAVVGSGCGSEDSDSNSSATDDKSSEKSLSVDQELHDSLPQAILEKGYISNYLQAPNAPLEFQEEDGNDPVGIDPELTEAVSQVLGIEIRTTAISDFASLLPSLDTGRADMVFSAVYDTSKRRSKGYTFVNYLKSFTTFMIRDEDSDSLTGFSDMCGKKVSGVKGTNYPEQARAISKTECEEKGLEPIEVLEIEQIPQEVLQLKQGRIDGIMIGAEYAGYEMKQDEGTFALMDEQLDPALYGVVFRAEDTQLRDAVQGALKKVRDEGVYEEVLAKWGASANAIEEFTVDKGE